MSSCHLRSPLLLALLLACGGRRSAPTAAPTRSPPSGDITLDVDSHYASPLLISILHDGMTDPLGEVTNANLGSWIIPASQLGSTGTFRLEARPIGLHKAARSERVTLVEGQHRLIWTVESDLAFGTVLVFAQ
jgi:hypothetical protein